MGCTQGKEMERKSNQVGATAVIKAEKVDARTKEKIQAQKQALALQNLIDQKNSQIRKLELKFEEIKSKAVVALRVKNERLVKQYSKQANQINKWIKRLTLSVNIMSQKKQHVLGLDENRSLLHHANYTQDQLRRVEQNNKILEEYQTNKTNIEFEMDRMERGLMSYGQENEEDIKEQDDFIEQLRRQAARQKNKSSATKLSPLKKSANNNQDEIARALAELN